MVVTKIYWILASPLNVVTTDLGLEKTSTHRVKKKSSKHGKKYNTYPCDIDR